MPALLERPKLSNAMARALHKHIMRERERKRQEEEEVDKMMEQKMKEEEERKRTKEIEERMSLEETKEQRYHDVDVGQLSIQPAHARGGSTSSAFKTRHYQTAGFSSGSAEHGQFSGAQGVHEPYGVAQPQHPSTYAPGPSVPVSFASSSQIRGASAFQAMQYLPHQQPGYPVHSHFTSQPGYIPGAGIPLQKQLEHANQQSGFTDAGALRPMHPPAMHPSAPGLLPTPSMAVQIPTAKSPFQSSPQGAPRHSFLPHSQPGQRFYHHGK
ncbi:G protein pathway suppressor 2 [Collichthys lucidus]|uniref:G protein pathway suppressor 2 n=1 Tax=Collichthys lucidus TaxID=240159 RepID=A0A4U5VVF6_COLLU|nr:G protein pathway suppressor 2 [Collichthys lucidus]